MKQFNKTLQILVVTLFILCGCKKTPQVYTVNSCWGALNEKNVINGIKVITVKGLEGEWAGLEHRILIETDSILVKGNDGKTINRAGRTYTAQLMDTMAENKKSELDTTPCRLLFIEAMGKPWMEVRTEMKEQYAHAFILEVSTFLKVEKINKDTVIVKMPSSSFTDKWLKANHYSSFVPYLYRSEEEYPLYITEEPSKLAGIFFGLGNYKDAFLPADTLIRKR